MIRFVEVTEKYGGIQENMKKSMEKEEARWPEKAYNNLTFLNSPAARSVRVLCEFEEPDDRFRKLRLNSTIVFFGSARTLPPEKAKANLRDVRARMRKQTNPPAALRTELASAQLAVKMSRYYADAAALSEKLTKWAMSLHKTRKDFVICSGGGPGIMEAANLGATRAGGPSIGLNISLPFEQTPNRYQTKELAFEFHYFFIRKFWFVYLARALVVFPGGFGTFDELFTLLTLVQTHKTRANTPIVLYGEKYWKQVINFDAMAEWGVISPQDIDLFRFTDDVDETFKYLKKELSG